MATRRTNDDTEPVWCTPRGRRRFKDGKPIDITGALSRLIEARRTQRSKMCAKLKDLIQAAQGDILRDDRVSAFEHFRAAIELAGQPARPKGE
jgi:hypothetical protein